MIGSRKKNLSGGDFVNKVAFYWSSQLQLPNKNTFEGKKGWPNEFLDFFFPVTVAVQLPPSPQVKENIFFCCNDFCSAAPFFECDEGRQMAVSNDVTPASAKQMTIASFHFQRRSPLSPRVETNQQVTAAHLNR